MKSQLIVDGMIAEANAPVEPHLRKAWVWEEALRIGLGSRFEIDGGGIAVPTALLIDSGGDRTNEVYEFSGRDPRILPTKGMSRPNTKLFYETNPKPGVRLWMVDTNHFKGALWQLMHDADTTKWMPHKDVSEQYCLEMASESLVNFKGKWVWQENGTARTEALDCEVLQRAAAEMFNVATMETIAKQMKPAPTSNESRPVFGGEKRW